MYIYMHIYTGVDPAAYFLGGGTAKFDQNFDTSRRVFKRSVAFRHVLNNTS